METGATIDPGTTALLVMDFQSAVLGRVADAEDLLSRVAGVIATARSYGVQVGYVRVAFEATDLAAIPARNKAFSALAGSGRLHADSPDTAVHERVAPQPGDIVVRKVRVGAFSTTDLDRQLRDRGITTLVLAGISTSGVVLSTVRDAADRDYELFALSDGCADPDPEVHEMLVQKVFPRQANVIAIADLPSLLPRR